MKWKLTKMLLNYILHKNTTRHFKEHCTNADNIWLIIISFFLSQANLVFKSNPVFIDILESFCHSVFTFSPFGYWYFTDLEVHPVPLRHWNLDEIQCSFKVFMSICSYYALISMKSCYLLTVKITTDVNNYL